MFSLSRRRFLTALGGIAAGSALAAARGARRGELFGGSRVHRRRGAALGTTVSLTVVHADRSAADEALNDAFRAIDAVEDVMSLYRPHSQLCRLNRDGVLNDPHPDLLTVVTTAEELSRRTDGAFDVTVQPLWDLFSRAHKNGGALPSPDQIERARSAVDWRRVELSTRSIRLRGPRDGHSPTAVTLNGIAQGFALDRVAEVLRQHGIDHALIDTGEVGGFGRKQDDTPWRIGIPGPRDTSRQAALADLDGRCLATSGDYRTAFGSDFRDHHIFDPRTGRSPTEVASVTVVAPNGLWADALSTALCVLGPEKGIALLESIPRADALFIRKDGQSIASPGFPFAV